MNTPCSCGNAQCIYIYHLNIHRLFSITSFWSDIVTMYDVYIIIVQWSILLVKDRCISGTSSLQWPKTNSWFVLSVIAMSWYKKCICVRSHCSVWSNFVDKIKKDLQTAFEIAFSICFLLWKTVTSFKCKINVCVQCMAIFKGKSLFVFIRIYNPAI